MIAELGRHPILIGADPDGLAAAPQARALTPVLEQRVIEGRTLVKVNPLVNWGRKDVWRHIFTHDLPYNPLHDENYPSVGCAPCTRPAGDATDERSGRWVGQSKTECGLHTSI